MKKFIDSRRFWAAMYFANLVFMVLAESIPPVLISALGAFFCVLNHNKATNE